jgi:hypothetical protein
MMPKKIYKVMRYGQKEIKVYGSGKPVKLMRKATDGVLKFRFDGELHWLTNFKKVEKDSVFHSEFDLIKVDSTFSGLLLKRIPENEQAVLVFSFIICC